eukprot:5512122-Prymnesium_polylepis.2
MAALARTPWPVPRPLGPHEPTTLVRSVGPDSRLWGVRLEQQHSTVGALRGALARLFACEPRCAAPPMRTAPPPYAASVQPDYVPGHSATTPEDAEPPSLRLRSPCALPAAATSSCTQRCLRTARSCGTMPKFSRRSACGSSLMAASWSTSLLMCR